MTRHLFVHIGTHKTGTTSLQTYLTDNEAALRKAGVSVVSQPVGGRKDANLISFSNAVLRPSLGVPVRLTKTVSPLGRWQRLKLVSHYRRLFGAADRNHIVISSEALCMARLPSELAEIRRFLDFRDLKVTPVLCVRACEDWRRSWKSHIETWTPQFRLPFGDGTDDVRGDWYYDLDAIRAFWSQLGPLREVDYNAATERDGTVLPTLLAALDVPTLSDPTGYFQNRSAA